MVVNMQKTKADLLSVLSFKFQVLKSVEFNMIHEIAFDQVPQPITLLKKFKNKFAWARVLLSGLKNTKDTLSCRGWGNSRPQFHKNQ